MKKNTETKQPRPYAAPEVKTVSAKELLESMGPALANLYPPPNGF